MWLEFRRVLFRSVNFNSISSSTLNVSGYQSEKTSAIPTNAVYVRINGTLGAMVFIYEITTNQTSVPTLTPTPTIKLSQDATNLKDAYDGKDWTSANVLKDNGYIVYKMSDIGLSSTTGSIYSIGTNDRGNHSVVLDYLDNDLNAISSSTLNISGFKCEVTADIPANAAYVKINGTPRAMVYIYEIIGN